MLSTSLPLSMKFVSSLISQELSHLVSSIARGFTMEPTPSAVLCRYHFALHKSKTNSNDTNWKVNTSITACSNPSHSTLESDRLLMNTNNNQALQQHLCSQMSSPPNSSSGNNSPSSDEFPSRPFLLYK